MEQRCFRMGILSKHLAVGEPLKIGEDTIYLKPLGTQYLPLFFKAMKAFGSTSTNPEDTFRNMDEGGLVAIRDIIDATLAKSLPDESKEDREAFGLKYMMTLLPKIMEINMQIDSADIQKKQELMKVLKKE